MRKVVKTKMQVLDLGAGSGQFLKALEIRKIKGIGYEPSKSFVDFGKKALRKISWLILGWIKPLIQY